MSIKRTIAVTGFAGLLAVSLVAPTIASSHREAPLTARDPSADNTDLYAFVSPDKPNTVTIISNYTGFQEPAGGPNFYPFDPTVLYWIKIDNNGDGDADVTYSFQFETHVANPDSFLYTGYGPYPAVDLNVTQTFSVWRNNVEVASDLAVPPPNIGPRSTPKYHQITEDGVHSFGSNRKVFAGQTDDPFFVDLGAIFDLGGLRPFNQAHLIPLSTDRGQDDLAAFNVNSIALQIPKKDLTKDGMNVEDASSDNAVVGIWTGASRQPMTTTSSTALNVGPAGSWVQVSRLGNPLINEVIIPIGQKDEWNASNPADDSDYANRYLSPELAAIINVIYPPLKHVKQTNRTDLALILGQGVPGLNATNSGDTLYDMLRLNMGIAPSANPNRMGVLAGDLAGFPNGRRLGDDVVDIALRAVAEGYGKFLHNAFGLPNKSPNNLVGDGCNVNDRVWRNGFPYEAVAWRGYSGGDYRNKPCFQGNQRPATAGSMATGAAARAVPHAITGRSRTFQS